MNRMNKEDRYSFSVVSGGQTGVDRGALDAAMALGIAVAGWCPQGRLAEDGPIPEKYPLQELEGGGYPERTLKNVVDSDVTVIIYFDELSGGTKLTYDYCIAESKPRILINGAKKDMTNAVAMLNRFVSSNGIKVLNIAGPRESKDDRAYEYSYNVIQKFLKSSKR